VLGPSAPAPAPMPPAAAPVANRASYRSPATARDAVTHRRNRGHHGADGSRTDCAVYVISLANISASTLPPDKTPTTILPFTSSLPASSAARPMAPPGSDHQLQFLEGIAHRTADFGVIGGDPLPNQVARDRKGQFARRIAHQRVADAAAQPRIGLALAALERAQRVIEAFRLGPCRTWPPARAT